MWSFGSTNVPRIPTLQKKVCNFVGGVLTPPCGVPLYRGVIGPDFTVSCLEECFNESYKAIIIDAFSQDGEQDGVIDVIETPFDISFNKPLRSGPGLMDLGQSRVASCVRSKSVGGSRKLRVVIGFQDGADDFL